MAAQSARSTDRPYSPLYFLAALGAGGLAVTFFMFLMFWVPHKGQPVPVFEDIMAAFMAGSLPMQVMIGIALAGIAFFSVMHIRLLVWNMVRLNAFHRSEHYEAFKESNGETQMKAVPLTLAMTINVGFILGLVFVPHLWSVVEYLFPLAIVAFVAVGIYAMRLLASFFGRVLVKGGFNLEANNSFAQLLPTAGLIQVDHSIRLGRREIGRRVIEGQVAVLTNSDECDVHRDSRNQLAHSTTFRAGVGFPVQFGERTERRGQLRHETLAEELPKRGTMLRAKSEILIEMECVDSCPIDVRARRQGLEGLKLRRSGRQDHHRFSASRQGRSNGRRTELGRQCPHVGRGFRDVNSQRKLLSPSQVFRGNPESRSTTEWPRPHDRRRDSRRPPTRPPYADFS